MPTSRVRLLREKKSILELSRVGLLPKKASSADSLKFQKRRLGVNLMSMLNWYFAAAPWPF